MASTRKVLLFCALAAALGVLQSLTVWQFLKPTEPASPRVAFADFLAEVRAGHVDEIRIEGDVYTFRVLDEQARSSETKRTKGPAADIAQVRALRPSDPAKRAPKVYFEE